MTMVAARCGARTSLPCVIVSVRPVAAGWADARRKIPDTTTNPRLLTGIPFTLCRGVPYACPLEPVQNPGHPHKFEWLRQLSPPPQGEARSGEGLGWGWAIFSINRNPAFPIVCCPHPNPLRRKQCLSLSELSQSHRDKHCSRSERWSILAVFPAFSSLRKHTKNAIPQDFERALIN